MLARHVVLAVPSGQRRLRAWAPRPSVARSRREVSRMSQVRPREASGSPSLARLPAERPLGGSHHRSNALQKQPAAQQAWSRRLKRVIRACVRRQCAERVLQPGARLARCHELRRLRRARPVSCGTSQSPLSTHCRLGQGRDALPYVRPVTVPAVTASALASRKAASLACAYTRRHPAGLHTSTGHFLAPRPCWRAARAQLRRLAVGADPRTCSTVRCCSAAAAAIPCRPRSHFKRSCGCR